MLTGCSFLSRLLDPLLSCIHWALPLGFICHLLHCLCIYNIKGVRHLSALKDFEHGEIPALCFSLNAMSSSSSSFFSFFVALRGLALPPCKALSKCKSILEVNRFTFSAIASHLACSLCRFCSSFQTHERDEGEEVGMQSKVRLKPHCSAESNSVGAKFSFLQIFH